MRKLFLNFILLLFYSCAPKKEVNTFIPNDYEFPNLKAGENKTFVFVDRDSKDSSYCDYHVYSKDGHQLLIAYLYSKEGSDDSLIYLDGKLAEAYEPVFDKQKAAKAAL